MNKTLKVLLSIPCLLLLTAILYHFFSDIDGQELILLLDLLFILQILYLVVVLYLIYTLWQLPGKSRNTKWTWTFLMLFFVPPITPLIYLWAVEPNKRP